MVTGLGLGFVTSNGVQLPFLDGSIDELLVEIVAALHLAEVEMLQVADELVLGHECLA